LVWRARQNDADVGIVFLDADGAVALVNSRKVAEAFGKQHDHVLRDIATLEIPPDLGRSWFREVSVPDSYGRPQPSNAQRVQVDVAGLGQDHGVVEVAGPAVAGPCATGRL
jgi:phage regulator Rha-like protein